MGRNQIGAGGWRKSTAWVILCGFCFVYGVLAHRQNLAPYPQLKQAYWFGRDLVRGLTRDDGPPGRWRSATGEDSPDGQLAEAMQELAAIGYLSGTTEAGDRIGVWKHDTERAAGGVNLYSSGHGPEALLIDMKGQLLHRWRLPFSRAFPGDPAAEDDFRAQYWRKVALLDNGDLLAVFDGLGIIRVTKDSELVWAKRNGAHHDLWVAPSGEIFVLTRTPKLMPGVHPTKPVLEDSITILDTKGTTLRNISIVKALLTSDFAPLLEYSEGSGDLLHTNTLEISDGSAIDSLPPFTTGRALISMPEINTVAIVDLELTRVVWAISGLFSFQHDPRILDNGKMLVFDNSGGQGYSRILEFDPMSQQISWSYPDQPSPQFFSDCCGTSQRLDNGNTLITESEPGRAFEVTPEGEIMWEFFSPHRAGEDGELVATLFDVIRLPADSIAAWKQPR